ncbi:cation/H(+) antiporter 4-like [Castanea sativa]|uniref:cation/H(+) antiporter 4-like n=1 Tax=Castanea sativa TaxID=21020 RepID=UPI003F651E62
MERGDNNVTLFSQNHSITIKDCTEFPSMVHSTGLWNYFRYGTVSYSLPLLQLQMILIFTMAQLAHYILKRYGVPKFTSQFIVGLILSPSLLGRLKILKNVLFEVNSQETIGMLAFLGYTLFLFVIGVKMDMGMINRTGRKALVTGILCIVSPLIVGMAFQVFFRRIWITEEEASELPFVTAVHCVTPFPVVASLLEDLKILNSELGRLSLSAALVSDMFSTFLTSLATLTKLAKEKSMVSGIIGSIATIVYVISMVFAIRPAMFWVIRQTPEGRPVKDAYIHFIMLMVLVSGLLSDYYGQTFFFGPFILGLAVPDGPPLGSAIVNKFNCFISEVFLPLFVTTCAMRTDLTLLFKFDSLMTFYTCLIIVTFVTKLAACMVPPCCSKMPLSDALTVSLILTSKGVVQLASYTVFRDNETMSDQTFALASVSILLIAVIVPILVKSLYDPSRKYAGYQVRDILHCKRNSELRILVCIQRPDNVAAVIKLLEASCPTRQSPLGVYALHLIELIGRASPIFISHQMQKKTVSNISYSENVTVAFNHFQRDNENAVSVSVFTAISPPKFMHEDICTLALDKLTSLIVLPFHRKWSIDGSIESEDSTVRTLNCSVLELAPCSVGILVDRGSLSHSTVSSEASYSIAMIFIGGNDDREALMFAKRMANDPNISLTVIRFVDSGGNEDVSSWDKVIDSEILKDVKLNNVGDEYVIYIEELVKDGPQTALIVRSMVDEYDLIIVGRRHNIVSPQTSGLAEWNEFPELGIIGDLLASSDINSRTSVFVLQQQKQRIATGRRN